MNLKIIIVLCALCFLAACGVELRDKNKNESTVSELVVEKEYSLPVPKIQSTQTVLRYDRLVLLPGSELITQGTNVRLEVGELIADNATIKSFKDTEKAAPGQNGRSGGSLELIVGKASGNLNIEMRGEQGGEGAPGAEPTEELRGPPGGKGHDALWTLIRLIHSYSWHLERRAESGLSGLPGLPGFKGKTGFAGGSSGAFSLKVTDATDFIWKLQKIPGGGGLGGKGGAGGPGGHGGQPGREEMPAYNGPLHRTYTSVGPQGPQGPQGPTGDTGPQGAKEKACWEIQDTPVVCD